MELTELDRSRIPTHVAVVMDGNGRWAQRRGLPRTDGHAAGEEALMDAIWGALDAGIRWLTVYAFSTENWKRPVDEVRFLMNFNERLLLTRRDELHAADIKMQFIGRRDWRVPKRVLRHIDDTLELTRKNRTMTVSMAFNYGGRAEIVDAVQGARRSRDTRRRRSTRRRSGGTSTTRRCRTRSWWSAPRASTACRTS